MLADVAERYFLEGDFNCAESVFLAANEVYGFGLDQENCHRMVSAFGGGMGCGLLCGAIAGAMAALGQEAVNGRAHVTDGFKDLCADTIVRYVRAMQNTDGSSVLTLHHLVDGKADALEFNVTDRCRNVGKKLMDMRFKPNTLLACINRMGKIIIPGGSDTLEAGDTVVVIAASNRVILDLNDIFADEE